MQVTLQYYVSTGNVAVAPLNGRMEDKIRELYIALDASYYRFITKGMVVPLPEGTEHLAKDFRKPPYSSYKPASGHELPASSHVLLATKRIPAGAAFLEAVARLADMAERELAPWPAWGHLMREVLVTRFGLDPAADLCTRRTFAASDEEEAEAEAGDNLVSATAACSQGERHEAKEIDMG